MERDTVRSISTIFNIANSIYSDIFNIDNDTILNKIEGQDLVKLDYGSIVIKSPSDLKQFISVNGLNDIFLVFTIELNASGIDYTVAKGLISNILNIHKDLTKIDKQEVEVSHIETNYESDSVLPFVTLFILATINYAFK